ncbi:hypothetical protein OHB36_34575 [Streptomyces sp. NBC_00320]|uniref:hypothetical protein n=1 Tax=Streptomyces sp. NBC_00320 TaxID=2975711 RepID=UPI002254F213|nr:hypothetical protein [Streptomyces sp. NBC_00320]MCX5151817.1 hypothetical protein [Streptomyces sp. NBC_00320]
MKRLQAWIGAAVLTIPLFMSLGAEGVQAAPLTDVPLPLQSGADQSVRPGEQVSVSVGLQDAAGNGDRVFSEAFTADGRMRMNAPHVTAVMTISCTAAPGAYEVRIGSGGDRNPSEVTRLWGSVRVAPAEETERAACARRVSELPPEPQEEHWPADVEWPATPWDVRSVRAGGEMTATDGLGMGGDGGVTLTSSVFTRPVVMYGAKKVSAVVRIRCDAKPGLYKVVWREKGMPSKVWARLRVEPAAPDCQDPAPTMADMVERTTSWLAAGICAAALAVGVHVLKRRRRTHPSL